MLTISDELCTAAHFTMFWIHIHKDTMSQSKLKMINNKITTQPQIKQQY